MAALVGFVVFCFDPPYVPSPPSAFNRFGVIYQRGEHHRLIVTTNRNPFQLDQKQGGPLWRGAGEVGVCLKKKKRGS